MEYWRRHFLVYGISLFLLAVGSLLLAHIRVRHALAEIQVGFERRFRETLENIDLLAVSVDANGRITFCNHAWLGFVDLDRNHVIGKDWFENFIPQDIRAESVQRFRALIARETNSAPHECEIQTRSGDRRLITWNTSLMSNSDEQVVGMTYIGQDITEARQGEEQLRKLSRVVEQSSSTVMIADTDGRIEYVNPKFTELTGYSFDEVRGKNPRFLKSGEMSDDEYRKLWQTITTGGEWRGVFHNRKKNGELYWEAACISAIRDPHDRITHFLAVKENITEHRRLEQEVEERKLEMRKNRELAAVGRMANMIAHDLRNPLSSVKMGLQILANRPVKDWGEDEKELKQISLQQIQYMEDILSDLLAYSRPEALNLEWLSMDKLMDTTSILVQKQVKERQAQLTSRYQPGLPTLFGDARKLKQAFSNLIVNAVQSTEAVANRTPVVRISVELQHDGGRPTIRVSICDNGPGIDDELKGHLFEPFYTRRAKGTGLGLAIVKRVVEQHQGEIWFENLETGGACVNVILPTTPEDARDAVHEGLAENELV
jgi:PAS domain S-box-containing protein